MSDQLSFAQSHTMGFSNDPNSPQSSVSSTRLRSNLLHKLGIHAVDKLPPSSRPAGSLLKGAPIRSEPLKYDSDEEMSSSDDDERDEKEHTHSWGKPWTVFRPPSDESRPASDESRPPLSSSVSSTTSSASSSTGAQQQRQITFNDNVTVVPIPKREDYSHRVKERLWTNMDEINLNAQRNALEFASEGWDWRRVTEDQNMYRDADSGELIHPVHLEPS